MKKQFEEPQIEVVELQEQDVICTSGVDSNFTPGNPFGRYDEKEI